MFVLHYSVSTVLLGTLITKTRFAAGDWKNLNVEPGTVTNVWGFCQGEYAAPVAGGWINNASDNAATLSKALKADATCHMGMASASNFSLIPHARCALTPDAAAHTCNCIGVPQCGRGSKCHFDCSCNVLSLSESNSDFQDNASLPRMLEDPSARPVFVGSIKFKDGKDFNLECALPLDFRNSTKNNNTQMYLHGYEIVIQGVGVWNRRCPDTESEPPALQPKTMHSSYKCDAIPLLKRKPLAIGDVFQQKYTFSEAASRWTVSRWLWVCLAAIQIPLLLEYVE